MPDGTEIKGIYRTEISTYFVGEPPNERTYVHRLWVPKVLKGSLLPHMQITIRGRVYTALDFQGDSDDWIEIPLTKVT